jgi:ABC-2 type transport system permease protein
MIARLELVKTFRKRRTYIGFIAIAVIVPVVEIAFSYDGSALARNFARAIAQNNLLPGNLFNAWFVTQFLMNSLWVHIPFLITLVAGDMLAGEATAGTFRLLLTRPPSRTAIFFAKFTVTLAYAALLVLFLAGLAVGLGLWLFGSGDLLVMGRTPVILPAAAVPARLALSFAFAIWSMWCVASLALLFSSFVENAIGPIVGTMAVIIVCMVVGNIPLSFFEGLRPWLFTSYMNLWHLAIEEPVSWTEIIRSAAILGAFTAGFGGAAWLVFARKDVLS